MMPKCFQNIILLILVLISVGEARLVKCHTGSINDPQSYLQINSYTYQMTEYNKDSTVVYLPCLDYKYADEFVKVIDSILSTEEEKFMHPILVRNDGYFTAEVFSFSENRLFNHGATIGLLKQNLGDNMDLNSAIGYDRKVNPYYLISALPGAVFGYQIVYFVLENIPIFIVGQGGKRTRHWNGYVLSGSFSLFMLSAFMIDTWEHARRQNSINKYLDCFNKKIKTHLVFAN
jgi:hypothetical protein